MSTKAWEIWADKPVVEGTLADRARGKLPEMESTKQLVNLVAEVYKPGMRILDVGCNAGHYLVGLRRLDPKLMYVGVDAYDAYISQATNIFADDSNARFEIKNIMEPLFPQQPFDITYSCNVLLHLPNFKLPVRNLLDSTKSVCFIRTLLGDQSTIVRLAAEPGMDFDGDGNPERYIHQNTYDRAVFREFVQSLGWTAEFIDDEFDPSVLANEHDGLKKGSGTRIVGGEQADGNILFNWEWIKITRP